MKNRNTLQLILTIMLIDHQSGSTDENQNCKDDMAETLKQMLRFWAKLQIINSMKSNLVEAEIVSG